MARQSIWTRAKHRVGLERPHFWEPSAAQRIVRSLQPRERNVRSLYNVFCPRQEQQINHKEEGYVDHQQKTGTR